MRSRSRFSWLALALVGSACHSEPDEATPADDTTSAAESSETSASDRGTQTDPASTSSSTAALEDGSGSSGTPGDASTSGAADASSDEAPSDTSGIAPDAGSASDESSSSDGSVGEDPFPPAPPFGTNVLDLDLVGSWGLNWQPESGFDSVIEIDATGSFAWLETSADCSSSTTATGYLWVEGMQIVMHVETWERPLPWDTEPVLGETFEPPFRLRMSFSLQGGGGDAYLTVAGPTRLTDAAPYLGSSYVRIDQQGAYLGGSWRGEAELQAVPAGETEPVTIVRDVYEALLDAESNANAESTGTRAVTTTYFPVPQAFYEYDGGNWTCLDGCPADSGLTLVDGGNLFTYGPYAGYEHLLPFVDGRTFRRDVVSDCP